MALTTVPASLSATALTLTTAAQPNITSVGTLTGLTVSGNIAGTLTTAAQTNITSVGTLSSLTVSGNIAGTLTTAAQTNITSVGTLTGLTMSGALTLNTGSNGVPTINLSHSNSGADNFRIMAGITGVSNSGFSIYDVDASASRLVINSSGHVGIGTASPTHPLEVTINSSGAQDLLILSNDNTATSNSASLLFAPSNGIAGARIEALAMEDFSTSANRTADLLFYTRKDGTLAEKMRIDSSGNILLSSTLISSNTSDGSDNKSIMINGGGAASDTRGGYVIVHGNEHSSNPGITRIHAGNVGSAEIQLYTAGSQKVTVDSSGNVGIGASSPSAKLDIVGGGTSTSPTLELISNTSNVFNHAVNAFNGSLTAGENNIFIIGKEGSTKNSGYIGYKWNGTGSNTNAVTFGHWSSDNLMNLTADGRLGIGTQTPASYDTDSGGVSADLVVANSGHAGIVVASGTGSDAGIFFGDGVGNAAYRGAVSYVNSQERLYFKASGVNYLTLDNTRLNAMGINLDVGVDTATVNFTDSVANGNTKYIEIGANGASSLGDALLVTHCSGSGVGYFGYESGNDRLIIACDNGGGNNTIEFSVNAGTATGGSTDNLNGATAALTIGGDEVVTTAKHVRQSGAPGFKVKDHAFTKATGWTHIGASILTVDYNNNSSGWSSSNGRFTPTRAGYYLFCFGGWANASTNGARYATSFAKNNSLTYIAGGDYCSVDSPLNGHTEVIYMNGSTDYVQLYAYSAISCTWGTNSHAVWWSAMWLH